MPAGASTGHQRLNTSTPWSSTKVSSSTMIIMVDADPDLLWVVDDRPSRRFPVYTRGNTGEVYPNVITPLCGSIVKDPISHGQALVLLEMGAVLPSDLGEADRAVVTGC